MNKRQLTNLLADYMTNNKIKSITTVTIEMVETELDEESYGKILNADFYPLVSCYAPYKDDSWYSIIHEYEDSDISKMYVQRFSSYNSKLFKSVIYEVMECICKYLFYRCGYSVKIELKDSTELSIEWDKLDYDSFIDEQFKKQEIETANILRSSKLNYDECIEDYMKLFINMADDSYVENKEDNYALYINDITSDDKIYDWDGTSDILRSIDDITKHISSNRSKITYSDKELINKAICKLINSLR